MDDRSEEIDPTANWTFRAFGSNLKELYENAAYALFALEGALDVVSTVTRQVEVTGADRAQLLVNWLNALLRLQITQHETYQTITVTELSDTTLHATIQGAPAAPPRKYVQAVTDRDLEIKETASGWQATIVVEV